MTSTGHGVFKGVRKRRKNPDEKKRKNADNLVLGQAGSWVAERCWWGSLRPLRAAMRLREVLVVANFQYWLKVRLQVLGMVAGYLLRYVPSKELQ